MMKKMFFTVLFFISLISNAWATAYYADFTLSTGDNDGTSPANAFQNLTAIDAASFSTGDDLYFKCGETHLIEGTLRIDWSGNSGDWVNLGQYEGTDDFDCSADTSWDDPDKPILNGNNTYPSQYSGLIELHDDSAEGSSYVRIQSITIQNSNDYAIEIKGDSADGADGPIIIDDVYIYRPQDAAVVIFGGVTDVTVRNSYIYQAKYDQVRGSAVFPIKAYYPHSGKWFQGNPTNVTIQNSWVDGPGCEWANIYHPVNLIIEDSVFNLTENITAPYYGLNICGSWEDVGPIHIRNNLFYTESTHHADSNFKVIFLGDSDNSRHPAGNSCSTVGSGYELYDIHIYGNLVTGFSGTIDDANHGGFIAMGSGAYCTSKQTNSVYVYNNTSIDNDSFISFSATNTNSVSNFIVKNNIVWRTVDCDVATYDCAHYRCWGSTDECENATYDYNLYDDDPKYRISNASTLYDCGSWCEGANDPGYPDYTNQTLDMNTTSGYRALTDRLSGEEMAIGSDSDANDEGQPITNYNERFTATNFDGNPPNVSTENDSGIPDIGAWMLQVLTGNQPGIGGAGWSMY